MSNLNRAEKLVLQGTPQYQRAVTPTVSVSVDTSNVQMNSGSASIRPKGFSSNTTYNNSNSAPNSARRNVNSARSSNSNSNSSNSNSTGTTASGSGSTSGESGVGVSGTSVRGSKISSYRSNIPPNPNNPSTNNNTNTNTNDVSNSLGGLKITSTYRGNNNNNNNSSNSGIAHLNELNNSLSTGLTAVLPRPDLIPLTDDIPSDKIIFARVRNYPEMLVCFRTPEERSANPG